MTKDVVFKRLKSYGFKSISPTKNPHLIRAYLVRFGTWRLKTGL